MSSVEHGEAPIAELRGRREYDKQPYAPDAEEVDLVQLWHAIVRRRRLLAAVFIVCALLGAAYAFLSPPKYTYTSTIEIGQIISEKGDLIPVESPATALAKLKNALIPIVLSDYARTHPDGTHGYQIGAAAPKGSLILTLESKGPRRTGEVYLAMQQKVAKALVEDDGRQFNVVRDQLLLRKAEKARALQSLQDNRRIIKANLERLKSNASLLKQDIASLQASIDAARKQQQKAIDGTKNEVTALAVMMESNLIREAQSQLLSRRERLEIGIPQKRDTYVKQLADNKRAMETGRAEITNIAARVKSLRPTRIVLQPSQSLKPVGIGKIGIIALASLLGIFAGLFSVFIAEFLKKARHSRATQDS